MLVEISKRKLESYRRAEIVAREARYQLSSASRRNEFVLSELVISWMRTTGSIKFDRPIHKSK